MIIEERILVEELSNRRIISIRVWPHTPFPMGTPRGPHPHPPWGWGIDFEKPRGWGILTQTPWGFGGVFDVFLCFFRQEIFCIFTRFSEKKPNFFLLENFIVHFANKFLEQPYSYFMNYAYSQQCGGRG